MKKMFFSMIHVLLAVLINGCCSEKDKDLNWDQLVSEGSNYLIRADSGTVRTGRKVLEEILTLLMLHSSARLLP